MATIINNPPATGGDSGSGVGLIVGIVVVIAIVLLLLFFGLPALRGTDGQPAAPAGDTTQFDVNVPDDINVDLNSGDGAAPQPNP